MLLLFYTYKGRENAGLPNVVLLNDAAPAMFVHLMDGSPTMSVRLISKGLKFS